MLESIDRLGCIEVRELGINCLLKVPSTSSSSVSLSYVATRATKKHRWTLHESYRKDGAELA